MTRSASISSSARWRLSRNGWGSSRMTRVAPEAAAPARMQAPMPQVVKERRHREDPVRRGEAQVAVGLRQGDSTGRGIGRGAWADRSSPKRTGRPAARPGRVAATVPASPLDQIGQGHRLAVTGAGDDHFGRRVEAGGDPLADPGGALIADHRADAGGAEAEFQLGLLVGRVGGNDPGAEGRDRVKAGDEPGIVAEDKADAVTGADAATRQAGARAAQPGRRAQQR